MTYGAVAEMNESGTLTRREYAAIAKEGIDPPEPWQHDHRWRLAASPGWDTAWDYAKASHPENPDYDPGDDDTVITDGMILSSVQKLIEEDRPAVVVTVGSTQAVPSTDPKVVADPQTAWSDEQFATFADGEFFWDGDSWVEYVAVQLPPQITSLEPSSASITDADFEGHIRGLNFTEDSVIIWNGAEEPTRFVDSTDIWTMVVPSVVTAPTVLDVYVRNGDGQVSGIVPFTWES